MSNKRLIDGTALLKWVEAFQKECLRLGSEDGLTALDAIEEEIESGRFDVSNQGEAARLREALKYIKEHRGSRIDDEIVAEIDEALSSYTEDTGQSERIKLLLEMYGLYKGTPLEDSHEDYKRGVRDTLEALGITIPGITDGGEQDA